MPKRIAMFVLNPCHNDARVRKEAATLGQAGYDVRIFALGNSTWPEELLDEGDFTIQRLEVNSVYQRSVAWLGQLMRSPGQQDAASTDIGPQRRVVRRLLAMPLRPVKVQLYRTRALVRARVARTRQVLRLVLMALTSPLYVLRWFLQRLRPVLVVFNPDIGRWMRAKGRRVLSLFDRPRRVYREAMGIPDRLHRRGRLVHLRARRRIRRIRGALRRLAKGWLLRFRNVVRRRLIILHRPSVQMEFWKRASQSAGDWEPDAVHGHDLNALPAAAAIASARHVPMVYDSHELWRHRNKVHGRRPIGVIGDALQEHRLIRRADAVITVAESIGDWLGSTYQLPSERIRILRNVPLRRDGVPGSAVSIRRDYGLQDRRIFLYTGRITTGRGIEEAVQALPHLDDDVVLVMLGYGDEGYVDSIVALAARHRVADRLIHVPPVPSEFVPAVAAEADAALVAVHPICLSYNYALPNKLFEAIQGHVPVVATDLPEIAKVVRRFGLGELYDPDDGPGLARSLRTVLADPERYRAGCRIAAAELCWEQEARVLVETYESLVPITSAPRAGRAAG